MGSPGAQKEVPCSMCSRARQCAQLPSLITKEKKHDEGRELRGQVRIGKLRCPHCKNRKQQHRRISHLAVGRAVGVEPGAGVKLRQDVGRQAVQIVGGRLRAMIGVGQDGIRRTWPRRQPLLLRLAAMPGALPHSLHRCVARNVDQYGMITSWL